MKKNRKVFIWYKKALPLSGLILFSLLLGFCLSLIIIPSNFLINNKLLLTSINFGTSLIAFLATAYWFPKFNQFIKKKILRLNVLPKNLVETYIARISTSLDRESIVALLCESVLPSFLIRPSALVCIDEEPQSLLYFDGIAKETIPTTAELLNQDLEQQVIFTPYPTNNHEYAWIHLILPLRVNQRVIGFWCLGSKDPDDIYKVDEIKILKSIASQTAIALAKIQHIERVDYLLQENIHRHEQEQSKLARDLHDEVLNGLVVLGLTLEDNQISPEYEKQYKSLTGRIRRMINGLRPTSLKQGLWYALEEKIEDMRQLTRNKINIEFNIRNSSVRYHPTIEGHLFRIIQQALDNAIQHSIADNIRVFGAINPDSVTLGVEDDGIGLPSKENSDLENQSSKNHYGMTVMKERAELIDAELNLISDLGRGTKIEVTLNGIAHKQDEYQARIKAEKSLKEREHTFRELIDSARYGILMVDEQEILFYANPIAVNIFGYSSPELLQLTIQELIPTDEYQNFSDWFQTNGAGKYPQPIFETKFKTKSGEIIHLEMTLGKTLWNGRQVDMLLFNDISAKIQIEEALKQSEETLYKIFDNANDGIIIINQVGDHLYVNQYYSDITGYSIAELLRKNMRDLVVGEKVALRQRMDNRFAGIKSPSPFETTIKKNDGTLIPVIGISTRITWQGQTTLIGFIRDISAQRQAEEALLQSEEKFKAIVENANDGIFIANQGGQFVYTNQKGADITGYSQDELLTLSFQDLVHPVDLEKTQMRQTSRIKGEPVLNHYEVLIVLKDGSSKPIDINFSTLKWNNQPVVLAIVRDISERKITEEILRNSEMKFKAIVETSNAGIIVGDEVGKHIYANPRAAEITGYSIDELMNTTIKDLAHPDEYEGLIDQFNRMISEGKVPRQVKTCMISKNGGEIPVEITAIRSSWNHQNSIIVTFRDIT